MPTSTPVPTRIAPQAAITATRALIGPTCGEELASDIVEVIRPHLEYPYVEMIKALRAELETAKAEIERLRAA
jgi:hypothetical protein